jgi:PDZ domain-containing protein
MIFPLAPRRAVPRPTAALVAIALVLAAGLATSGARLAGAQTKAEDLPPPPGALEQELSLGPLEKATGGATDRGAQQLASPIDIPFILEGGHIVVEASIDGDAPRPFIFDTGGRNVITPLVPRPRNASVVRTAHAAGIGSKILSVEMIKVRRITIGAATLDEPVVSILDLPNTIVDRGSRPRLAGLIGPELLARYAVTIDYARRILTLRNPGFRPQSAAFSLPLGFSMSPEGLGHPSIRAELDGLAGEFMLDTGAGSQILVSEQFEREHAPLARYGKVLTFLAPGGIGGRANMRLGLGKQLRIGPLTLSPPRVASTVDADAMNRRGSGFAHTAGIIGAGILAQFVVTLDRQAGRAYFEPVAGRNLPTVLRGTGMIIDKPEHEYFEVLDAIKGSAAERAGLRRGDRIIEVAGRPARDLSLSDASSPREGAGSLTVRTSDRRLITLAVEQMLP